MPLVITAHTPVIRSGTAAQAEIMPVGGWISAQRARKGRPVGSSVEVNGKQVPVDTGLARWLSFSEMWTIYRRTPDLRAAIDSIVRRVATWDWNIEVNLDTDDPNYGAGREVADLVTRFLKAPNEDGETWQELMTKFLTDLLVFDQGVLELVRSQDGMLAEIVALRGSTVTPSRADDGRLDGYVQDFANDDGSFAKQTQVDFGLDEIVFMRQFPSTAGPGGNSLCEAIVDEVVTLLHSSKHLMLAYDADELPPGIIVLAGIAGKAADKAVQDLREMRGQDHKIRVITTPDPSNVGAKWLELRRTPKDLAMREAVNDVRRVIWRVFGVLPVEMGMTEDVPRASAQVQLDVATSHLVNPLLELIEAKVNARIIPMLVQEADISALVNFHFDREARLSPEEENKQATTLDTLVAAGILTRNEAREVLGKTPREEGDILTVDTICYPLGVKLGAGDGSPPPTDEEPEKAAPGEPDEDNTDGVEDGSAPGEAEASIGPRHDRCAAHPEQAFRRARELPSAWQSESVFAGYRTLNLTSLGDTISKYAREIRPIWRESRDEVLAAMASAYDVKKGGFDDDGQQRVTLALQDALERLEVKWRVGTGPLYADAAKVGRDAAVDFSGNALAGEGWEDRAETYYASAMGFLTNPTGPVETVRRAISTILGEQARTRPAAPDNRFDPILEEMLDEVVDEAVLLASAEAAFNGQEYRIFNWSGKLNDLSNEVLFRGLEQVSEAEGIKGRVEWWASWEYVGDKRTCATCEMEGSAGMRPLTQMPVRPGGDTECAGNCRCVLVFWTKEEVDNGTAIVLNN